MVGGLASDKSREDFGEVVRHCCQVYKPRYAMGIGYPFDLVVWTSLGVDMYDCVWHARTVLFGVDLVDGNGRGNRGSGRTGRRREWEKDCCIPVDQLCIVYQELKIHQLLHG